MSEKIYIGSGRKVQTNYGELTKVSFSKKDINEMVAYMKANNVEWINLVVKGKKDPQPGKPDLYLEVDTWKPTPQQEKATPPPVMPKKEFTPHPDIVDDDVLPF